jgi:hypothetical protein
MIGSQTESSLSPITTDDDAGQRSETQSPELITLRDVGQLRQLEPEHQFPSRPRDSRHEMRVEDSFEMVEQPTSSSGSADEADYVQVYNEDVRYGAIPSETSFPSTSRAYEMESHPLESRVYHHGFYEQVDIKSEKFE